MNEELIKKIKELEEKVKKLEEWKQKRESFQLKFPLDVQSYQIIKDIINEIVP